MTEIAVEFPNARGETLVGVFHEPSERPRAAIVMLHGWSGTRSGPHQMLTRAARQFCVQNYAVLRFDFAGRGDSDGDSDLATLATMQSDTQSALAFLRQRTDAPPLLLGLCSGCEIAFAALTPQIAGVILWSAPIFAALPSTENAGKKRSENLGKYAKKLLSPATWQKILRGQVDTKNVSKALQGGGGAAHKNVESNEPGQLPPGFRAACLQSWKTLAPKTPILMVYGGSDPIYPDAVAWYRKHSGAFDLAVVPDANHSFYGLAWEEKVLRETQKWLQKREF